MKRTIIFFCFLLAAASSSAQNLTAFNLDASAFPVMKAKFIAFDANGNLQSPLPASFTILENGIPRTVTAVTCATSQNPKALSVALTIDVSSAVTKLINGITDETLEQQGTSAFGRALDLGPSECAFVTFDNLGHLHRDFTVSKTKLLNTIQNLNPGGSRNYNFGLLLPVASGLTMTSEANHQPIIIMATDGLSDVPTQTAAIIAEAQKQNCKIYAITLRMNCPQELKDITTQTGGAWFENISTTAQIEDTYLRILEIAEGLTPCEVTWQSDLSCDSVSRSVIMIWGGDTASFFYTPPASAFAQLQFNPSPLYLNSKPIGIPFNTSVTATAINSGFTIINITSSNPAFDINPKSVAIAKGASTTFTVTYTPSDSGYAWTDFTFMTDKCDQHYYVSGGYQGVKPKTQLLKIISPNGGEQYVVGTDTAIYWSGISPNDPVKLDYSTDDGALWNTITNSTTGNRYSWHIPNSPSNKCLVKASQITSSVLQTATSDAHFSIVIPQITALDVDFGSVNLFEAKDTFYRTFITNQGNYAVHVDSITIIGANASEFSQVSGFPPYDIPAGGKYPVEFVFIPTAIGAQNGSIGIYTSGISSSPTLTQKIRGKGFAPLLEIEDSIINFGTIAVSQFKDTLQAVTIKNISLSPITISSIHKSNNAPINSGVFIFLSGGGGFTLNPGEIAKLDFRFTPVDSGRVANEVMFEYDSVGSPATVQLFGKGVIASADITVGDASGYPGDQVNIPILLKRSQNIAAAGVKNFTTSLSFNASLLYPIDSTPIGTVSGMVRTIPLTLPASPANGNILTTLPFRVMLGTDTTTLLTLSKDTAIGGFAILSDTGGVFHLLGTCTSGGARLFDPSGQVSIAHITPNPVNGIMHIDIQTTEVGRTQLSLMNLLGARVATISDGELKPGAHSFDVNTNLLPEGSYFLMMQTPTVRRMQRVDVEK